MFRHSIIPTVALAIAIMAGGAMASSWQTIGSLTDPCNLATPGYMDITQAWVEKQGSQLKFVMTLRDTVPTSTSEGDENSYLWLVDADNNPNTGQSTYNSVGSEFNVRAVVGSTGVHGYIDLTGQWAGLNSGATATITGNKIEVVIDMPQILAPDLFHFRSDAFWTTGGVYNVGNDVTPQSAECWASRYAVLMDPNNVSFGVESNVQIYKCDPCDPLNTATGTLVIDKHTSTVGSPTPVFDSMEGHDDGSTPGTHVLFGQATAVCDFLHVRTEAVMDIAGPDAGAYGQVDTKAAGWQGFKLLSRDGQTGVVPRGVFLLDLRHGHHLHGIDVNYKVDAISYAQIVINDLDADPMVQAGLWGDGRGPTTEPLTGQRVDTVDLADMGLQFNRRYQIDTLVTDTCRTNDPAYATLKAQAVGHSDLVVTFRMVHPTADLNGDRTVDFKDMAVLAGQWLLEK